jgi:hypothetical protein
MNRITKKYATAFIRTILLLVCYIGVESCNYVEQKRSNEVIAECCGKTLTLGDIENLTNGYSGEDSARIAEDYIRSWATELLMYENSLRATSKRLEELIEDYRRSLYIHEYEQLLVEQHMSKTVEDTLITMFYNEHKQQLKLQEMILKGALIVVPNGAPNMSDLRRHLNKIDQPESLEWLEKYVYQYGVGYELFTDEWKLREEVVGYIPIEKSELEKLLRKNQRVEIQDSVNTYLLEVIEYCPAGGVMPIEYAHKDIEETILRARRIDFLQSTREEIYDKSIKNGKVKRYEN